MNRLGIHAQVWVGGWTNAECETAIAATANAGYDFIEVPMLDPQGMDTAFTRDKLAEYGLGATISLALPSDCDIASEYPAKVERGQALLHDALRAARDIGATHMAGVIYAALQKNMRPVTERGLDNAQRVLRELAQQAADSGIVLALETVNRYETNVINTSRETVALIERIGADNITAHLDSYHMNIEENSMQGAIVECGAHLGYLHVGESHRGYLGSGSVDFDDLFRGVAQLNYTGPIAFESFSSAVVAPQLSGMLGVWRNLWDDSDDLARHALGFMQAHLKSAHAAYR